MTKIYFKNSKIENDLDNLNTISNEFTKLIYSKEKHVREMNEKRNDCLTARKTYWKILNRSSKNIKIPLIPPLLVNGETVPNFLQKAELFKKFFASQCCFFKNSSTLPPFNLQTDKVVDKFSFSEDNITQIIKKLNLNK